jgi:hypothetical protein
LSTSIRFDFIIEDAGTICDVDNIDEFGFLIASQENYLAGNDIDAIKDQANVTTVATVRGLDRPTLSTGPKETTITGLTHPATRYARFYAKTSNDPDYASAFVISDVISATTDTGDTQETQFLISSAGAGDTTGYSTIPTLAEIEAKADVTQGAGKCYQEIRMTEFYHNGNGRLPVLGDKVKYYINGDYTGGYSSSGAIDGASSGVGKYYALAVAESTGGTAPFYSTVGKYIVVEWSTAEVVAVYVCPSPIAKNVFFYKDAGYGIAGFAEIPTSFNDILYGLYFRYNPIPVCGTSHIFSPLAGVFNGKGTFPVVGDNVAYSSSYNYDGWLASFPNSYQDATNRYIALTIVDEAQPRTVSNFIGFIVVDLFTSKVVARFDCP